MTLTFTTSVGEAAHACLQTLVVIRKHKAGCRQCRTDPEWCSTHEQYQRTFVEEFTTWEKLAQRASA
jgi:hypothetical protein